MKLSDYSTIAFDCDGVILNSNKVKTNAFYDAALPYGENNAEELKKYHTQNGGISRFKKFRWFVDYFLERSLRNEAYEQLLTRYADIVEKGLLNCEFNKDLYELKKQTPNANWLIVSGGSQSELRALFKERNLAGLFEGGIYGSPDSKEDIFDRELEQNNISVPALFIGDSKYDYFSSSKYGLDFVFLSQWTEVDDWKSFCEENGINYVDSLKSLNQ
ncbi:HAD family hydrolase [uncultured Alteromonas sp.]|jgi:phosphoglycolate phosphatase-like HAD superfamily hydrolase|uniref:HAD family hydrolase n=1 Tax=uncultured Alteromonas sp. TaxID=179113 RepID=UPI0030D93573